MGTILKTVSFTLPFLLLSFTDASACKRPSGFIQPTPLQLLRGADAVIYGPIEITNGKILIQPEKTLKKAIIDKVSIVFSGGTCGAVQSNWLNTGDYCLVYLDANHDAGMYSSCTMGDKNGVQKKRLDSLFEQLSTLNDSQQIQ